MRQTSAIPIDIITAIRDPNILGDTLAPAQEAALRCLYGLPLDADQAALAAQCTGRVPAMQEHREAAFICGRRSGKSDKLAANVAIYEAFFRRHRLSPGERGIVLLMAQNVRAANVVAGYIRGKIERSPILSQHVVSSRALEMELDNGITIAIHPSSFRAIRGLSVVTCICDEIAFWFTEAEYANPDVEVVRAVRPAMATFPHAKLILVSSPYAKAGVLWDMWNARHVDADTLVWHAPTSLMNPTVRASFLEKEKARDPEIYAREYDAQFTDAVSSFIPGDAIEACVVPGRTELAPNIHDYHYFAAIDAAFRGDSFTFCVAHRHGEKITVDHLTGWEGSKEHPVRLADILPKIKAIAARYQVTHLIGDQYGAEPLKHAFKEVGLTLEEVPFTTSSKADILGNLRSLIVEGRVELLDHARSIKEIRSLEVEALPGGASRIGHPRRTGAHDDFAVAIALAAWETRQPSRGPRPITSVDQLHFGPTFDEKYPDNPWNIYGHGTPRTRKTGFAREWERLHGTGERYDPFDIGGGEHRDEIVIAEVGWDGKVTKRPGW